MLRIRDHQHTKKHQELASRLAGFARLGAGVLSGAAAPFAVVAPKENPGRLLAIGGSEFSHLIALIGLSAALPGRRAGLWGNIGGVLGGSAAILALTPLLQALRVAVTLPHRLTLAFGQAQPHEAADAPARPAPLVLTDLFRGVRSPQTAPETLLYSTPGGVHLSLDLYRPLAEQPAPCVIMVHGGSWQNGNSTQLAPLNHYLAARGYAVAAINYRLVPGHTFPAARDDVLAAIDYVKQNAAVLNIDPTRIALIGRSAGAHLALLAAYTRPDPAIRGVVSFYAPIDLRAAVIDPQDPSKINEDGVIAQFLGGSLRDIPDAYEQATPLNFVGPTTPPTLLIHGSRDRLVWEIHSKLLARRLDGAGRPHLFLRMPWAAHGCDFYFSGPSGQVSTYAIERFLAAVM